MIHIIKPKTLSSNIYYSQILQLKKCLNENYDVNTKVWISKSDAQKGLEKYDFIYERKLNRGEIEDGDIIYFRNPIDYLKNRIQLRGKAVKYIYDFRAILAFESWYRNNSLFKFVTLYILEFYAYFTAHQINAVSSQLSRKLQKKFLFKREVNVIPCLTRKCEKKEVNDISTIKFVYVGGTNKWQCIEEVFKVFEKIKSQIPNSTLTFYTKDEVTINEYSEKYDVEVDCLYVNQNDVFKELQKYHFGFLLRESNLINKVASPIKFLEYIGAGVIPIMTEEIGDYSKIVKEQNLGLLINIDKLNIGSLKRRIFDFFHDESIYQRLYKEASKFTWDSYKGNFLKEDILD